MGESPASEEKKEHESPVLTHLPMCDGCGWMDSLLGNYYKLKFYILSNSYVYALTPCMMVCAVGAPGRCTSQLSLLQCNTSGSLAL